MTTTPGLPHIDISILLIYQYDTILLDLMIYLLLHLILLGIIVKPNLCHRPSSVVRRLSSVHNSQEMLPSRIRFQFCLVCLKELVPMHKISSPISEILITNKLVTYGT